MNGVEHLYILYGPIYGPIWGTYSYRSASVLCQLPKFGAHVQVIRDIVLSLLVNYETRTRIMLSHSQAPNVCAQTEKSMCAQNMCTRQVEKTLHLQCEEETIRAAVREHCLIVIETFLYFSCRVARIWHALYKKAWVGGILEMRTPIQCSWSMFKCSTVCVCVWFRVSVRKTHYEKLTLDNHQAGGRDSFVGHTCDDPQIVL